VTGLKQPFTKPLNAKLCKDGRGRRLVVITMLTGLLTAFGLGFGYFVAAIPAGVAAGAPLGLAALAAWLGYSSAAAVVILGGVPLRAWILKKFNLSTERDPQKWIWKVWARLGVWGLGLIAPVTIGPHALAVLAIALGERPWRTFAAISLGVVPWCAGFAAVVSVGGSLLQ
jgi:hypothetical protein